MFRGRFLLLYLVCFTVVCDHIDVEDNEFAEFEDSDDTWSSQTTVAPTAKTHKPTFDDDDDGLVDIEDDFNHLRDEEEFEGFDHSPGNSEQKTSETKIKFANVLVYRVTNWDRFYMEILMLVVIGVYFVNFVTGRARNHKLASQWLAAHRALLEANFSLVGDDGSPEPSLSTTPASANSTPTDTLWHKQCDSVYTLWCSGRVCCEGMLVQLKLLKRQDLVSVMSNMLKGQASDQVECRVTLNADEMDTFVFCLTQRRSVGRLCKEMPDLASFCPERRAADRVGITDERFVLLAELFEICPLLLDSRTVAVINKYATMIDYIHVSDQYSGPRQLDESGASEPTSTALHRRRPSVVCCFNVPATGGAVMRPLLQLVFHIVDRLKRCRLSKEARQKAERSRQRMQESLMRQTHQQRAEKAQAKRDEKRRLEKERIIQEEDPDKQRRLEERSERREARRKQPRMKQMRVKAL